MRNGGQEKFNSSQASYPSRDKGRFGTFKEYFI